MMIQTPISQSAFLSLNHKFVTLEIGRYIHEGRVLLVDDVQLFQRTTLPPTPMPTFAPTKGQNTGPTSEPTIRTESPTTTNIGICPLVGDAPLTISAGSIILRVANIALCTLSKSTIASPESGEVILIPIARSYNNNPWEQATGEYATSIFDGVDIQCYTTGCQLNLPALEAGATYILSSSSHSLSESDEYARFLETATFGVTQEQLNAFADSPNSVQDDITNWISEQMNSSTTPMTSHREYWRKGVMTRVRRRNNLNVSICPILMRMLLTNAFPTPSTASNIHIHGNCRSPLRFEFKVEKAELCSE